MLYREKAELYDLIYHAKDYAADVDRIHAILEAEGIPDGSRVLDVACGTGLHLPHLARWYEVEGLDLSQEMLAIARRRAPVVPLVQADMCDFEVEAPFDVVLCLFSSLGYARPDEKLAGAARSFFRALAPGGVLVVEPWIFPEDWRDGEPHLQTYEGEDIKLCRTNVSTHEGRDSILDFHWLVVKRDEGVEHFTERHLLRMYTREEYIEVLMGAGFTARFEEGGRGVLIARRPN